MGGAGTSTLTTVTDILPTILDLAGVLYSSPTFRGREVVPILKSF